jgi:hypothetical protein
VNTTISTKWAVVSKVESMSNTRVELAAVVEAVLKGPGNPPPREQSLLLKSLNKS